MNDHTPARQDDDGVRRAMCRAAADAIERARIFDVPLVYGDRDGNVIEVKADELLARNPNLLRELMGNDDPPIGHFGPLPPNNRTRARAAERAQLAAEAQTAKANGAQNGKTAPPSR